jgi:glycosyltransferase involved in cell wall biosynthesis
MNSSPDVTVVIPTRARPVLLQRAIRSALEQTWFNLEVIVVLDGDDGITSQAIAEIADSRVRLVTLAESVGGAEARNVGARLARGRYIALLDDDDEWMATKLEKQLAFADACAGINFVVVTEYLYRTRGEQDEIWPGHLPFKGEPLSEFLFSSRGGFQTSTYLCPRELFLRVPFTKGLKKHQDWDWFLRIASLKNFELLVVSEPLSVYWVPLRERASVSAKLDWRFSHSWAKSSLPLMTPIAFSKFLVKICVRSAAIQNESLAGIGQLFRDLLVLGRPTPLLLGEFAASLLVPENLRHRMRYGVIHLRRRFS